MGSTFGSLKEFKGTSFSHFNVVGFISSIIYNYEKKYLNRTTSLTLLIITMYLTSIDDVTIQGYLMLPQVSQLLNLSYNIPLESMVFKVDSLVHLD
jgi:hypothetical protein